MGGLGLLQTLVHIYFVAGAGGLIVQRMLLVSSADHSHDSGRGIT